MIYKCLLIAIAILCTLGLIIPVACTKNSNPQPPVHDTTVIVRTDTVDVPPPPDPTVNLTKGLLLYLPFSGNIADSSGNGNPTTAVGSVLTYDAHGYANNAFGATGNGNEVLVTNNGSIQFDTAYSISLGFMVNVAQFQYFMSMVDPVTGEGPSWVAGEALGPRTDLAFGTEDVTLGCSADGKNDNINITDTTGFIPIPGSWYNLICIYHKGSAKVFINGQLVVSKTGAGTSANLCAASQIVVGGWWNGQPLNLNGKLDDIRLYNRVLTPHEIATLASNYQVTSNRITPVRKTGKGIGLQ